MIKVQVSFAELRPKIAINELTTFDNNKTNKKLDFNEFPSILRAHLCNCQDSRRLNTSFSVFTAAKSTETKSGCECLPKIPTHLKNQFSDRFSLARFHINAHVHSQLSQNRCKNAKSMILIAARPRAGAQLCLHRVTHRKNPRHCSEMPQNMPLCVSSCRASNSAGTDVQSPIEIE